MIQAVFFSLFWKSKGLPKQENKSKDHLSFFGEKKIQGTNLCNKNNSFVQNNQKFRTHKLDICYFYSPFSTLVSLYVSEHIYDIFIGFGSILF